MSVPAVFLDRDNTLIADPGYVDHPDKVRLLPGAGAAVRRLGELGYKLVLVSNQSGVARGLFDEPMLQRIHARLEERLAEEQAQLDAAYYCPYLAGPEATVDDYRVESPLRKPAPGMLQLAAREHDLDLSASWMIGDSLRDVEAGQRAGCRTILLDPDQGRREYGHITPTHVVPDLHAAAELLANPPRRTTAPAPTSAATPTAAPTAGQDDQQPVVRSLERIHDLLERIGRQQRYRDFSVLRLVGALAQMTALAAALWGLLSVLDEHYPAATAQLLLAVFLQLTSLTAFALDRFR